MDKDWKGIKDKIHVIMDILKDEFSELPKERVEEIANRLYDLDGKFDDQTLDNNTISIPKYPKIGYKLGGSFEDCGVNGSIGFEIVFPYTYSSYEEAEKSEWRISAYMKKQDDGEVVIVLCENKAPVETIHWDEWWKYKCNHIKDESKDSGFVDANADYEPCSASFEQIFRDYCGDKEREKWPMQYLAYWVEPIIVC